MAEVTSVSFSRYVRLSARSVVAFFQVSEGDLQLVSLIFAPHIALGVEMIWAYEIILIHITTICPLPVPHGSPHVLHRHSESHKPQQFKPGSGCVVHISYRFRNIIFI